MKISKSMLSKVCLTAAFVLLVCSISAQIIGPNGNPNPQQPPVRPTLTIQEGMQGGQSNTIEAKL